MDGGLEGLMWASRPRMSCFVTKFVDANTSTLSVPFLHWHTLLYTQHAHALAYYCTCGTGFSDAMK
eukprot:352597-Chlamydomonas_euryale.AAC.8